MSYSKLYPSFSGLITNGLIYPFVPFNERVLSHYVRAFDIPKSPITILPLSDKNIFAGLRSLWITFCE